MNHHILDPKDTISTGRDILVQEAQAVLAMADRLGTEFERAVELVLHCEGRVVTTGMGKSGAVARKIAGTLASTGAPALFLHPAEGVHGDLGMVATGDVLLALSNSGNT
ncbi:MAG: SIS domain-containing protein, partial [bacterium]